MHAKVAYEINHNIVIIITLKIYQCKLKFQLIVSLEEGTSWFNKIPSKLVNTWVRGRKTDFEDLILILCSDLTIYLPIKLASTFIDGKVGLRK